MDLSNFHTLTLVSGKISMTVSRSGVSFSQATVACLGKPELVDVLINPNSKELAIKVTNSDDTKSTRFFKPGKKNPGVRWNNRLLKDSLVNLMKWDLVHNTYRIEGEHVPDDKLVLFRLGNAKKK